MLQFDTSRKQCQRLAQQISFSPGEFSLEYANKTLKLHSLTIHTDKGKMAVSGQFNVDTPQNELLSNFSVLASSFPLESVAILVSPKYSAYINGTLDASAQLNRPVNGSYWKSVSGKMKIKGWHAVVQKPHISIDNVNLWGYFSDGKFHFKGNDTRLANFNTDYPIQFSTDLEKKDLWSGTLRLYSKFIDLTAMPSVFKEGKTDIGKELPFDFLNIYAQAEHVRYRNLIFKPLLLQGKITENRIFVEKALVEHGNDLMWLTGSLSGNNVIYDSYFKLRQTPVNPFMALLGFESKSITGSMDMEAKLTAAVEPGATIFESSRGALSFEIKDGTIESSSPLIKILDLISLENIFDKKDVLQWKNTLKFDLIQGRFDLTDGIFSTDSFVMDASAFDIFAQGKIDTLKEYIDMEVKLLPISYNQINFVIYL